MPDLVERFNAQSNKPFELRLAVPADFEALVARRSDKPIVRGDFNPVFQGTYSSRIELKQRNRELEQLLMADEKLGVLLSWLGSEVDEAILWRAWEPVLFNQAHDLMAGVMTDHVYDDTIRGYDFSRRIASDEMEDRLGELSEAIDTRGDGVAVLVWNLLGWPRTDVAVAEVGFSDDDVRDVGMIGPDGQTIPVQILDAERSGNGAMLRAKVAFVAQNVPAMGYAVYRLLPRSTPAEPAATPDEPVLENEFYRLEFDSAGGAITRLIVKPQQWDVLSGPGNVVAREEDRGDLWELYRSLNASQFVTSKEPHTAPKTGGAVFSSDHPDSPGTISRGKVISEFHVAHPFGEKSKFATSVRLYPGIRRIDIRTRIFNDDKFVRYRVLFPTSIRDGQNVHEIPFGAIQRPEGVECPAQNWCDYGDGRRGLALLNRGLPGNNVADGTMMLSLMRSTRIQRYGYIGGYGPGMASDSGFELGKELTFDYALVPHAGDWRGAGVYRDGLEFNQPLLARATASHPGLLPKRWGFLQIDPQNVVVSSLKTGPDGTVVLRIFEASGKSADTTIRLSAQVIEAEEVNLLEDTGQKLTVSDNNTLCLHLRPFEIKTIKLRIRPLHTGTGVDRETLRGGAVWIATYLSRSTAATTNAVVRRSA